MDIVLTENEIVYLGCLTKKENFYGLEDNFNNLTDKEIDIKFKDAKLNLKKKRYISISDNKEIIIDKVLYFILSICYDVEKYVKFEIKRNRKSKLILNYYIYSDVIVSMEQSSKYPKEYVFNIVRSYFDIKREIFDCVPCFKDNNDKYSMDYIVLEKDEIQKLLKVDNRLGVYSRSGNYNNCKINDFVNERIFTEDLISVSIFCSDFLSSNTYEKMFLENNGLLSEVVVNTHNVILRKIGIHEIYSTIKNYLELFF